MDARLQKYAKLAVRKGVNLQKGQTLIINTSVEALEMTRACVEEAYQAGAKEVLVFYKDDTFPSSIISIRTRKPCVRYGPGRSTVSWII